MTDSRIILDPAREEKITTFEARFDAGQVVDMDLRDGVDTLTEESDRFIIRIVNEDDNRIMYVFKAHMVAYSIGHRTVHHPPVYGTSTDPIARKVATDLRIR